MQTEPDSSGSLRGALTPSALRAALVPQRPVFANPWDSEIDMFACYFAVSLIDPFLLWLGGKVMGAIFGFDSHWPLGLFMIAALVGAAGFMTVVGRRRSRLSVDVLAIAAWIVLGLIVAPVLGPELTAPEPFEVRWAQPVATARLRDLAGTRSFLLTMPDDEREARLAEVDALAAEHPALVGRDEVPLPYVTRGWCATRRRPAALRRGRAPAGAPRASG